MKVKFAIKLTILGILIVTIGQLLRGHDFLAGLALSLLFIIVLTKVVSALILRRRGGWPPSGMGGSDSGNRPVPRPPGEPRPALTATAKPNHAPNG